MSDPKKVRVPGWIAAFIALAGVYNLVWGAVVIGLPNLAFELAGMELPRYPEIWQCVGMIVGVYGIGYLIAARDSNRHWPIILVGFLGKVLGPIGFASAYLAGKFPLGWGTIILFNDLIWWPSFAAALYYAWRYHADTSSIVPLPFHKAIRTLTSHRGATLDALSRRGPTLVVFLRHAGCTFCREALADLKAQKVEIDKKGVELAIVHMGSPLDATMLFEQYGLENAHRFSDPECVLYDAFDVRRGSLVQVLGPQVWWRGLMTAIFEGHGMGPVQGDVFRMPGLFALRDGEIIAEVRADYSSDRPDYREIADLLGDSQPEAGLRQREAVGA